MRNIRIAVISLYLLLLSAIAVFADVAPIEAPVPKSESFIGRVLPAALGAIAGVLVGRLLVKNKNNRR